MLSARFLAARYLHRVRSDLSTEEDRPMSQPKSWPDALASADFCYAWPLHYTRLLIRAICVSCYWSKPCVQCLRSWNFIRHQDMARRTSKVKGESLVTCKDPLSKRKTHSRCLRIKPHSSETAQVIGWPHKELCLATLTAVLVLVEQLFFQQQGLDLQVEVSAYSTLPIFFF